MTIDELMVLCKFMNRESMKAIADGASFVVKAQIERRVGGSQKQKHR